jgi:hypothetical protein
MTSSDTPTDSPAETLTDTLTDTETLTDTLADTGTLTDEAGSMSATKIRSGRQIDRLAVLEDERRFLLRSLRDLEREHDAGDVDDLDYATLKDGYTVRTASVLRQIEAGRRQLAPKRPRRWGRTLAVTAAVVAGSIGIGFVLADAWGEREPGQSSSGATPGLDTDERDSDVTRRQLAQAREALSRRDFVAANTLFVEVDRAELERGGQSAEARTYVGWTTALRARGEPQSAATTQTYEIALLALQQAISMDKTYADPYCFSAIIEFSFLGDADAALPNIEQCEALDPPADVEGLVASFADEIRSAAGNS